MLKKDRWMIENTRSLYGKTVAITGASGGLGREICRYVLELSGNLILLNRNPEKSRQMQSELTREFPQSVIQTFKLDLSDMESVRNTCEFLKMLPVDVLIHNAGVYKIPRKICSTGFNSVFQINFVSPYYMTKELLPLLSRQGGKIVAVGSVAHNYAKTDPEDVDFSTRTKSPLLYGNSKRYLMVALQELLRGCDSIGLTVAHPGITVTNITAHYPGWLYAVIKWPMKLIFMKPSAAARSIVQGIFEEVPYLHWLGPGVFNVWGRPTVQKLNTCPERERKWIFKTAEQIYRNLTDPE